MGQRDIIASVKGLMEANWCEGEIRDRDYSGSKNKITPEKAERFFYTCPDRNIYPHQWFWDSCFHIIINSKLSELNRALKELSTLLANQSEIGHIGHMNYWMSKGISPIDYILKRYYPDKDRTPLIQPAFLAHAFKYLLNAIKILKKNNKGTKNSKVIDEFDESDIFKEYYPKILKYYLYILNTRAYSLDFIKTILLKTPQKELERQDPINLRLEVREKLKNFESLRVEDSEDRQDLFRRIMKDLGDEFIIFNIHPWESGTDNIPIYDKLLKIKPPFLIIKWMIKMLRSLSFNKKDKWVVPAIIKRNYFVIGDVLNNSVFADGLTILSKLAAEYNQASDSEWLRKVAQIHVASIYKRMYSDEDKIFYSIDIFGNFIKVKAVSSFAPLNLDFVNNPIIKEINKGEEKRPKSFVWSIIKEHLLNEDEFYTKYPVPSVALNEKSYNPQRSILLWRGPTWIATNWYIIKGLENHVKILKEADDNWANDKILKEIEGYLGFLKKRTIELVNNFGFREYYHPKMGTGYGAKFFSWSGLVIDLLEDFDELGHENDYENENPK